MRKLYTTILLLGLLGFGARGADIQKLVVETQKMVQEPRTITMVWWIPTEFWDTTFENDPSITPSQRENFRSVLGEYMVFSVASIDVGPFGGMTPKSREQVIANTKLTIGGQSRPVLTDAEISPDARNFMGMMKPMMASMLGQLGQGMEFLLYSNTRASASRIEARERGGFAYTAFGKHFEWRLPLGSLLPPMYDPNTNEEFPGNYLYNPYTGEKLHSKENHPDATSG